MFRGLVEGTISPGFKARGSLEVKKHRVGRGITELFRGKDLALQGW